MQVQTFNCLGSIISSDSRCHELENLQTKAAFYNMNNILTNKNIIVWGEKATITVLHGAYIIILWL